MINMLNRLSNREKYLLLIALFMIIIGLYYFYYHLPQKQIIDDLDNSLTQKNTQLNSLLVKVRQIPELEKKIKELEMELFSLYPPDWKSEEDFFKLLAARAKMANINIERYIPEGSDPKLAVFFKAAGNFENLVLFIGSLTRYDKLFVLDELNFTPINANNGLIEVNIKCLLEPNKAGELNV